MRLLKRPILSIIESHAISYPTPSSISYMWNFGVLAIFCLVVQLLTGIFLAMHYAANVNYAFDSVEHIMRDVPYGWLLRYTHANGASMFFIVVYIHIGRGLYYGSYRSPRIIVWLLGVVLVLLMMATAFIGYVLPWGQMSYWGATVITNLFSALPVVGKYIVSWIWGGFSVDNATLNRFFSLHYLLPFAILAASLLHLTALHQNGSSNPLGTISNVDKISFHPYFTVKDIFGVVAFALFFSFFVYFYPNTLGHPDNYIEADAMVTPTHIVPEWYFLWAYAILRAIPNKLAGVLALFGGIVVLAVLPFITASTVQSSIFRPLYKVLFWVFIADWLLLTWLGGMPAEEPYITLAQIAGFFYFAYFLIVLPVLSRLEYWLIPVPVLNAKS
jgi:ubiquinol-cytochrome c reductase cytochrome b subunit